jgi:hypothetical protein
MGDDLAPQFSEKAAPTNFIDPPTQLTGIIIVKVPVR